MTDNLPPKYVAYPRGPQLAPYGSVEKLIAVADGFLKLNGFFLYTLMILTMYLWAWTMPLGFWKIFLPFMAPLLIAKETFGHIKKIAFGMGWETRYVPVLTISIVVGSAMLLGPVILLVIQNELLKELKKYGVKTKGLITKATLQKAVRRRRHEDHPKSFARFPE